MDKTINYTNTFVKMPEKKVELEIQVGSDDYVKKIEQKYGLKLGNGFAMEKYNLNNFNSNK